MKVTPNCGSLESACARTSVSLDRSADAIVYTLGRIAAQRPSPLLWPAHGAVKRPEEEQKLRELSHELEGHFQAMRRRARETCPLPMLPMFEAQLCEIEATVRGTVTGRLSPFLEVDSHIREVKEFGRKWVPYIDPPPAPPPRVRYDETDRSVWLDGRCIAKELGRKQFGFIRVLVDFYPDPVTWNVISKAGTGCRGGNQTRLRKSLPRLLSQIVESGPDGYALSLPARMSTAV